jgi:hypothetical protein
MCIFAIDLRDDGGHSGIEQSSQRTLASSV